MDGELDNGPITVGRNKFYVNKTIQKSYNYIIYFEDTDLRNLTDSDGNRFNLEYYHATSVELPNYEFDKEFYKIGNFTKSFPILKHDGFEFTIKFEEDDKGTIQTLIDYLTEKIITTDGYYNKYKKMVLDEILVSVFRDDGTNVHKTHFYNCYFLKASTPIYSYNSSEKIEYDITFNADHFKRVYGSGRTL